MSDLDLQPLLGNECNDDKDRDSNSSSSRSSSSNSNHNNNNNHNSNSKSNNSKKHQKHKDINRNVVVMPPPERRFSVGRKAQKLRYCWKRKSLLYLLVIALLLFLVHLPFNWNGIDDDDELMGNKDDVFFLNHMHSSHVPGMKVFQNLTSFVKNSSSSVVKTQPQSQSRKLTIQPATASNASKTQRMRLRANTASTARKQSNSTISATAAKVLSDHAYDHANKNSSTLTTSHDKLSSNSSKSLFPPSSSNAYTNGNDSLQPVPISPPPKGYLVWSEYCKMPSLDPYLPEVMKLFRREKYQPCKLVQPLTRVQFNRTSQRYVIVIDKKVLAGYSDSGKGMNCCYQSIMRTGTGKKADAQIRLSDCMSFFDGTSLDPTIDNILVECRVKKKRVYFNGHFLMPERPEIRERLNMWKTYDRESGIKVKPPSVLMLGIDSISRLNLIRAMPKTARYLYENEWFEMSGFNKIDDNTFPNLMAVLTGMNLSTAIRDCSPYKVNALNDCDFIWKTFRDHGYVTAYAEDEVTINTFNYLKVGFNETPVDYYLRPFLLAAEKYLESHVKSRLINCLGYKHEADFVFDYAVELAHRYRNDTFFGLFWANSFSHNDFSDCTAMDEHIMEYLKKFKQMGTLDNTIVIFFSDHGMRFGPVRRTYSGHMEERLPFVFLWLPPKLREAYPSFVNALNVNKNRLTNPYDTHMTLKHILSLSRRVKDPHRLSPSSACPKCQSLLEPVPQNRSCADAAIEAHWCTCYLYENIYKNSKTVVNLTHLLVDYINNYVATFGNSSVTKLCVPLQFDSVDSAYHTTQLLQDANGKMRASDIYRVTFYTKPNKGLFEATAFYDPLTGFMEVTGQISRLNAYVNDSFCISDGGAKKYCSCRKKIFYHKAKTQTLSMQLYIMTHSYLQRPLGNDCIHDAKDRDSISSGSSSNSNSNGDNNNNHSRSNESKKQLQDETIVSPSNRRISVKIFGYCCTILLLFSLIIIWIRSFYVPITEEFLLPMSISPPKDYLVSSENCKMFNLYPYTAAVMKHFLPKKFQPCNPLLPLTLVQFNTTSQRYVIVIDREVLAGYYDSGRGMNCCYQSIMRTGTGKKADAEIRLSDCMTFFNGKSLDPTIDNILVECRVKKKRVYFNGHFLMPERPEIRERLNMWKTYDRESGIKVKPPSVLMLGIDSISRLNLIRAMPKTASYLYENEWFEMSGFNKIDDNTFPNLMAVLTGMNLSTVMRDCPPNKVNALNDCDFIWKTYRDHGYVTAFAEDEVTINTFNNHKVGFNETPVDYYLRPFLLAAEKYLKHSQIIKCRGYKHQAEFVFDFALELAKRYKNDTFFGLFWANSFSHNAFSDCTAMDEHIMEYLRKFKQMGTLDNTIVIFFSDHGVRYGPVRQTYSGYMEERLPFVFLWIPANLRKVYPSFVNALNVNKNRLTNPYDTHMTLKHILSLSRRVKDPQRLSPSSACPKCQSLLEPVPQNRSCADAAIEEHWCTCYLYKNIDKNSKTVLNLTHLLVDYINNNLSTFENSSGDDICETLQFDSVISAYHTTRLLQDANGKMRSSDIYRITFYTKPKKALFEATAFYDPLMDFMKLKDLLALRDFKDFNKATPVA